MTGEYPWRNRGTGILPGDATLIIEPGRPTLPAVLKQAGYATGCVGKWHLGLGRGRPDWNGEIKPGPLEIGFDYCLHHPGHRRPRALRVRREPPRRRARPQGPDPGQLQQARRQRADRRRASRAAQAQGPARRGHDNTIINGIGRIGFMSGGKAARWKDEDIADVLTGKATAFIERNRDRPFFLYLATHDIHVPRVPHRATPARASCGVRGDVIQQLDGCVGRVVAALERLKLAEHTLVIFSSDNGPVIDDGYADGALESLNGHKPAGPLRGGKYTIYEGGTRMPFIARWPGRIKPGVSNALVGQVDLLASFAALAGQQLPADAGPDSFNVLPALLGEPGQQGREHLIEHSDITRAAAGAVEARARRAQALFMGAGRAGRPQARRARPRRGPPVQPGRRAGRANERGQGPPGVGEAACRQAETAEGAGAEPAVSRQVVAAVSTCALGWQLHCHPGATVQLSPQRARP